MTKSAGIRINFYIQTHGDYAPSNIPQEINSMKAGVEQGKNDVLKWILGIIFTIILAALGFARMVSSGPPPPTPPPPKNQ